MKCQDKFIFRKLVSVSLIISSPPSQICGSYTRFFCHKTLNPYNFLPFKCLFLFPLDCIFLYPNVLLFPSIFQHAAASSSKYFISSQLTVALPLCIFNLSFSICFSLSHMHKCYLSTPCTPCCFASESKLLQLKCWMKSLI